MILLHAMVPGSATDVVGAPPVPLSGPCELIVHLDVVAQPVRPVESGRDHLERRRAYLRRQERAFEEARALLAPWTVDSRLLNQRRRLAVLVDRLDADTACAAVAEWGQRQQGVDVLVTGPWSPFSFCEDGALTDRCDHG